MSSQEMMEVLDEVGNELDLLHGPHAEGVEFNGLLLDTIVVVPNHLLPKQLGVEGRGTRVGDKG
jgi:hypothetical protein